MRARGVFGLACVFGAMIVAGCLEAATPQALAEPQPDDEGGPTSRTEVAACYAAPLCEQEPVLESNVTIAYCGCWVDCYLHVPDLYLLDAVNASLLLVSGSEVTVLHQGVPLVSPQGLLVEDDGSLLIVDAGAPGLYRFDVEEHEMSVVWEGAPFQAPADVAVGPDGTLYVTDNGVGGRASLVWRLGPEDPRPLPFSVDPRFTMLYTITTGTNGTLLVVDAGGDREKWTPLNTSDDTGAGLVLELDPATGAMRPYLVPNGTHWLVGAHPVGEDALVLTDWTHGSVYRVSADGMLNLTASSGVHLKAPRTVDVGPAGILITDPAAQAVWLLHSYGGGWLRIAGGAGPVAAAWVERPPPPGPASTAGGAPAHALAPLLAGKPS